MNKVKLIFNQTLMISTAILFGIGVENVFYLLKFGDKTMTWPWYIPLSIVFTGFLCSLPTLLIIDMDNLSEKRCRIRIFLNFISVGAIVSLSGFIFDWFNSLTDYLIIVVMYVLIYIFVWVATLWILKNEEKKINAAIKDFRDEE